MLLLDYKDRRPIYEQVTDKLRELILKGVFEPDSQLPSVRNLATDLAINPNTIQRAYLELERQGYIYSVKGKGSFVADTTELKKAARGNILEKTLDILKDAKAAGIEKREIEDLIEKVFV